MKKKKNKTFVTVCAVLLVLLIVLALVACLVPRKKPASGHEHTDRDGDYYCDGCGELLPHEHADAGKDGKCDICGKDMPSGSEDRTVKFTDGNGDIVFGGGEATAFSVTCDRLCYLPGSASVAEIAASKSGVEWTAEWEDPSSEWAEGKTVTDYVRLAPRSGEVTVTFLAPFGERVKIVCSDGEWTRECLCDCLKALKTFQGFFGVVDDDSVNPVFRDDVFFLSRVILDKRTETYGEAAIMQEQEFLPYTLDQRLAFDPVRSTYTLTQEFIDSFKAFALAKEVTEPVRAKLEALSPDLSTSMVAVDPSDNEEILFGSIPSLLGWVFPLLTDGLGYERNGDAKRMGDLFLEWFETEGNKETEMIDAKYVFQGSVEDVVFSCRQKCAGWASRPGE